VTADPWIEHEGQRDVIWPRERGGKRASQEGPVRHDGRVAAPLLLTPTTEGASIEVVRGRLSRADAREVSSSSLEFRVPLLARSAGTAVLRVRADAFGCEGDRCRPVRVESSARIEIVAR
jgi:hypothetical protein